LFGQPEYLRGDLGQLHGCHGVRDRQSVRIPNEFVYLKIRYLGSEIVCSNVFDQMGLVKDDCGIIRYNLAELISSNIQVSKEQVVVHNNNVGAFGSCTHPRNKTRLEIRTFLAKTRVRFRIDPAPETQVFRQVYKFAPVTCSRITRPMCDLVEISNILHAVEQRLVFGLGDAIEASII